MMYEKAVLFKNQTTAEKILQTDDVAKIKAFGRTVQNFDDKVWQRKEKELSTMAYQRNSARILSLPKNWKRQGKKSLRSVL